MYYVKLQMKHVSLSEWVNRQKSVFKVVASLLTF